MGIKEEKMDLLSLLNEKIDNLLNRYNVAIKKIDELETEIANQKAQNEQLQNENAQLQETIALKDLELEEIVGKIESILGK
jgi:cell division protein ZapB